MGWVLTKVGATRESSWTYCRRALSAEGAVETYAERAGVGHRVPERLGGLAGERAAARIGDGAGDHDRHPEPRRLEVRLDGEERRLGVQRVEDRLDQEEVGAAVQQSANRFGVRGHQLVERDVPEPRVVHVGGERCGPVGGSEHAGHVLGANRESRRSKSSATSRASLAEAWLSS